MTSTLSPRLLGYLTSWHGTSTRKQAASGKVVDLSFDAFLGLFEKRQLKSLERAIVEGRLPAQQHDQNPYALVLSWRSYSACSSGLFNAQTACVCSRTKSAKINLPQKGDKLRPGHAANIAKALIGVAKSDDHRKSISKGCEGVPKRKWTDEEKRARSLLRQAQEAAKRKV